MKYGFYLLTHGAYSDFSVDSLYKGPAGMDMDALAKEFKEILDHGESKLSCNCTKYGSVVYTHYRNCSRIEDRTEIEEWRKAQPWYHEGYPSSNLCFQNWLVLNHGFKEVEYEEVWFDTH